MKRTPMSSVQVDTREYENSHAREPRGRGGWMFRIGIHERTFSGTYQQARHDAKRFASELGVTIIVTLP